MQFKSMDRTRFNWFSLKEIKELEQVEDKLGFINSFSFGPFVPINLYHFFHNLWDFYILERIAEVVYFMFFYGLYFVIIFNTIFKGMSKTKEIIDYAATNDPNMILGSSSFSDTLATSFTSIIIVVALIVVISYGIKIFQGFHCKRLSWNRCEWKDYDSFEQGERNWNIVGIIFFALQTLTIAACFAFLISLSRNFLSMFSF